MRILAPALLVLSLALALLVTGCTSSSGTDEVPPQDPVAPTTEADFDVITASAESDLSGVPVPNSLLLQDQSTGFISIPGDGEPFDSWNSLRGFSVSGHILVPFVGQVKASTVDANPLDGGTLSVIVFDTDNNRVVPCFSKVSNDSEGNSTIDLWPVRPMQPGATHLVVVTNSVEDTSGNPVGSVDQFELMKLQTPLVVDGVSQVSWLSSSTAEALEPLRQAYDQLIWPGAELVAGTSRDNIPMAFVFTTQPVSASSGLFSTLQQLEQRSHNSPPTPTVTAAFVGAAQVDAFFAAIGQSSVPHSNIGAIFIGSFPAPQYISDPLNGPFTYDANGQVQLATTPWAQARTTQGFICFLPELDAQAGAVIFQHGITRNYLDSIALADGACRQGLGVIAINAVLHGLNPNPNPAVFVGQNNIPGQASGTGFINLSAPRQGRDNIRQSVANLMSLVAMIQAGNTDFDGSGTAELSATRLSYIGQSLGGILGGVLAATEEGLNCAVLNVPGGRIGDLLQNSASISPVVNAGLASAGLTPGTFDYNFFFLMTQAVADDGDPFVYGPHLVPNDLGNNTTQQVLIQEMINDLVVPNSATEDLARAINTSQNFLPQVNPLVPISTLQPVTISQSTLPPPFGPVFNPFSSQRVLGSGLFQYTGGTHGFLLQPEPSSTNPILTVRAQTQAGIYLLSGMQIAPFPLISTEAQIYSFGQTTGSTREEGTGQPLGIPQSWDFEAFVRTPGE